MGKLTLYKKIDILCIVHSKKTEEIFSSMCQFYAKSIRNSRKRFLNRLRNRTSILFKWHSKRIISYVKSRKAPKVWMKVRCNNWWRNIVNSDSFDEWIENFRVDKLTYQYICDKLRLELQYNPNWVRKPIDIETKVGIALYKLASCSEYRVVANQFGVHKASVYRCLKQFCNAVVKILLPEEIKMPNLDEANLICEAFEIKSGLPLVLGAIDGCHIPVTLPLEGYRDYINRKTWASIVLQGIVDANYRFLDITVKHPGCTHDASVLKDSFVYKNISQYAKPSKIINGKEINAFLIGDPAYPLQNWLLKGYVAQKDPLEDSFNVYLNKARIVVENAFGRLKGRWRMIQKKIDTNINFVPSIVATCCVLHNIAEKRRLPVRENWVRLAAETERLYPQPRSVSNESQLSASDIRDHLKHYMAEKYPLLSSKNQ